MLLPVIFRFRGATQSATPIFLSACAFRDIIIRGNRINLASVDQRFSKHRRIIYVDDERQRVGDEVVIHECRDVNAILQLKFYISFRPRDFSRRVLDDSPRHQASSTRTRFNVKIFGESIIRESRVAFDLHAWKFALDDYVPSTVDVNNNCILTNKLENIWRSCIIKICAEENILRERECTSYLWKNI